MTQRACTAGPVLRITSADVARESGVSRTTVSYVLNGKVGVTISGATRERVREAATRLGYAPSAAARTLRTGRSDLVLCVLPNWPIGPVIDTLLDHLATDLAVRGLSVLVHHGRGPRPLSELWRAVTPRAVVGFTAFAPEDERAMRQAGIQVLGTTLDEDAHHPSIYSVSQTRIGRLQVQHLASAGHRRIGYAAPTDPRAGTRNAVKSYARAVTSYAHLVINHGDPPNQRILSAPKRAGVVTATYGTPDVTFELDVIATAPGFVCVRQDRPGQDPWNAWIPTGQATPL